MLKIKEIKSIPNKKYNSKIKIEKKKNKLNLRERKIKS